MRVTELLPGVEPRTDPEYLRVTNANADACVEKLAELGCDSRQMAEALSVALAKLTQCLGVPPERVGKLVEAQCEMYHTGDARG